MGTDTLSNRDSFTIEELASHSGFSVRTIHFYVQQGLVPRVGRTGPGVRYPREYLDRLLEIGTLKASRHTLAEIRALLSDPSRHQPKPEFDSPPEVAGASSGAPTEASTDGTPPAGHPTPEPAGPLAPSPSPVPSLQEPIAGADLADILAQLDRWAPPSEVPRVSRRTRWASVPLAERLTLVGRDLRSHELSVLERIADHLRALFDDAERGESS